MDTVKFHPNERLGLPDMEQATGKLALIDHLREAEVMILPNGRATGSANTPMRVFGGFDCTNPSSTTAEVTAGTAILSYLDGSSLYHGVVAGLQSPDKYTLDFGTSSPGTYAVYVRFVFGDANAENRVFWNPAAVPPAEEIDNVQTRRIATWEVTTQNAALSPPGNGEWMKIHEIEIVAGPSINAITDYRHFYFEGSVPDSYSHEWGDDVDDRNGDRTVAPVTDFHRFASMVRRKFDELQGANQDWFEAPPLDLSDLQVEHKSNGTHSNVHADSVTATGIIATTPSVPPLESDAALIIDKSGSVYGASQPCILQHGDYGHALYSSFGNIIEIEDSGTPGDYFIVNPEPVSWAGGASPTCNLTRVAPAGLDTKVLNRGTIAIVTNPSLDAGSGGVDPGIYHVYAIGSSTSIVLALVGGSFLGTFVAPTNATTADITFVSGVLVGDFLANIPMIVSAIGGNDSRVQSGLTLLGNSNQAGFLLSAETETGTETCQITHEAKIKYAGLNPIDGSNYISKQIPLYDGFTLLGWSYQVGTPYVGTLLSSASAGNFVLPLDIPHGANIRRIFADWTVPSGAGNVQMFLYSRAWAAATEVSHGSLANSGTGRLQEQLTPSPAITSVDKFTQYFLIIKNLTGTAGDRVWGIYVQFEDLYQQVL